MCKKIHKLTGTISLLILIVMALAACGARDQSPTPTKPATPPSAVATPRPTTTGIPEPTVAAPDGIDWPPQVVYSSPLPGEEVTLDGAITVRFDQPMNRASVEDSFEVRETQGDTQSVRGSFTWTRDDTVIFTPSAKLARQQLYRVQIGTGAQGLNGKSLEHPVSLDLETVGFIAASQVIPAPDTENVQTDSAITVLFNRPIVPLTATSQQAGLPQPLTFDPPLEGQGQWLSTSIYRFVPAGPLDGGRTYVATVNAGLEDIVGAAFEEDFTWSFTTVSPSVVEMYASRVVWMHTDSPERPSIATGFVVDFNMPMERASTENAITLDPSANLEFAWRNDARTVLVTPTMPLELDTIYTLSVTTAARSASGSASLDRDTSSAFHTIPFPAVGSVHPEDGQEVPVIFAAGASIFFVSVMDEETVVDQIRIEPPPDPEELEYSFNFHEHQDGLVMSSYSSVVYLSFPWQPGTTYTVTVPATAADLYGNTLGEDYVYSFTTSPTPPLVSFNLPYNLSQLTTSYPTTLELGYRSTAQVNVSLYDLGLPLNYLNDLYRVTDPERSLGTPDRTWSFPVEKTDDVSVLQVPLADGGVLPSGVYAVTAEPIEPTDLQNYVYTGENKRNLLVVADTNLVVKETFGMIYVWATDLATGEPAEARTITVYNKRNREIARATTGSDGVARIPYTSPVDDWLSGVLAVSNAPGEAGFGVGASDWDLNVTPYLFGVTDSQLNDEVPTSFYLITDRPIYRPGDTVHFRGILREQNYGRYEVSRRDSVSLRVVYTNPYIFQEDQGLTLNPPVDGNGNFSGELAIPEEWPLGNYTLLSDEPGILGERSFTVAEYRAPEFQVVAIPAAPEILRGEAVDVTVVASYFFGGPAADLRVFWTIRADPYFLPWDGPYFSFADDDFYAFLNTDFFGQLGATQYLLSSEGTTDASGRLSITFPDDLLDDLAKGSWRVSLEATVFDVSEFPVSARTTVIQHAAATYVGISPTDYLNPTGTSAGVNLITVDWDRQPQPDTPVEVVFYLREWQSERIDQFGQFVTRWTPVDTEVARLAVSTDDQGEATATFTPEKGGTYLARASITDADGNSMTSTTFLWVTDPAFTGWRTEQRERRMDLTPDKNSYNVGDTATVLVQSPFSGPVNAWLIIERGTVIEERLITLENSSDTIEIPIDADYAPNVYISVVALQGTLGATAFADIRLGMTELEVNPARLWLDIDITADRRQYQPGDSASYTIQVTDYLGGPVQADVSLALVDLAVLSLKPDNAPPILDAFYADQPFRSRLGSGLFYSGEGLELEFPVPTFGGGGGGNGLAAEESLALDDEDDARRNFRDTAFWAAVVTTGADGTATVSVDLPDNLTTWRMSARAATTDTLVGQAFSDVVSTKPLLIRPVTPRFMIVGDEIEIGAIVNNNSGADLVATVLLEAAGVSLQSEARQQIEIPSAASRLVRWSVVVDDVESADLTFRVTNDQYRDASKPTFGVGPDQLIPVYRYTGEDIVGTSGMLTRPGRRVEAVLLPPALDERQGTVEVTINASLASELLDALAYNETYDFPPACAYGFADRLLSASSIVYALDELEVNDAALRDRLGTLIDQDIAALERLQLTNGGWGWCYSDKSDPFLTGNVFFALLMAEKSGFPVDSGVLDKSAGYLQRQIVSAVRLNEVSEINRQAYLLYLLAEHGSDRTIALASDLVSEHRDLLHPYARAYLVMVYERTGNSGSPAQQSLIADLYDAANLSAAGAHWENIEQGWDNLGSDISGTAVVLSALLRADPDNQILPNIVRWLMVARTAGHWPSTHETAWSIHALADWMVASGELGADYDYSFHTNQVPLAEGAFNRDNLDDTVNVSIPLNTLHPNDVNFLDFQLGGGSGNLYYTAYLDSLVDAATVNATSRGIAVQRVYTDAACDPQKEACQPITRLAAGQQVRVQLTIIAENDLLYAIVEDHIPAGAEAIDPGLETSASDLDGGISREDDIEGYWGWWYFNRIEYRDEKVVFYSEFLPAGTYQYTYFLQTTIPGVYQVRPALARQEFFPDVFGRSEGMSFTIDKP